MLEIAAAANAAGRLSRPYDTALICAVHGCADRCRPIPCREATSSELQTCHALHLVHSVARKSAEAAGVAGEPPALAYFTQDTYVNAHTNNCARLAAGSCIDVATAVTR